MPADTYHTFDSDFLLHAVAVLLELCHEVKVALPSIFRRRQRQALWKQHNYQVSVWCFDGVNTSEEEEDNKRRGYKFHKLDNIKIEIWLVFNAQSTTIISGQNTFCQNTITPMSSSYSSFHSALHSPSPSPTPLIPKHTLKESTPPPSPNPNMLHIHYPLQTHTRSIIKQPVYGYQICITFPMLDNWVWTSSCCWSVCNRVCSNSFRFFICKQQEHIAQNKHKHR